MSESVNRDNEEGCGVFEEGKGDVGVGGAERGAIFLSFFSFAPQCKSRWLLLVRTSENKTRKETKRWKQRVFFLKNQEDYVILLIVAIT